MQQQLAQTRSLTKGSVPALLSFMHQIMSSPVIAQFWMLTDCSAGKDSGAPHCAGRLPDKLLISAVLPPRYRAVKEGMEPLLPQELSSLPLRVGQTGQGYQVRGKLQHCPRYLVACLHVHQPSVIACITHSGLHFLALAKRMHIYSG